MSSTSKDPNRAFWDMRLHLPEVSTSLTPCFLHADEWPVNGSTEVSSSLGISTPPVLDAAPLASDGVLIACASIFLLSVICLALGGCSISSIELAAAKKHEANKWHVACLGALCGFSSDIQFFGITTFVPVSAISIGVSPFMVSIIVGVMMLASTLCAPLTAWILQRVPPSHLVWRAELLLCATTSLCGLLQLLATASLATWFGVAAIVLRALQGVSISLSEVALNATIIRTFQADEVNFGFSVAMMGRTVGVALGPMCAGLAASTFGFAAPFLICSALYAACAAAAYTLLRDHSAAAAQILNAPWSEVFSLARSGTSAIFATMGLVLVVVMWEAIVDTFFTTFLESPPFNMTTSQAGLVFSASLSGGTIAGVLAGTALFGSLSAGVHILAAAVVSAGLLFIGPATYLHLPITTGGTIASALAVGGACGLIMPATQPVLVSILTARGLEKQAVSAPVSSLFTAVFGVACFVGTLIGGALIELAGFPNMAASGTFVILLLGVVAVPVLLTTPGATPCRSRSVASTSAPPE